MQPGGPFRQAFAAGAAAHAVIPHGRILKQLVSSDFLPSWACCSANLVVSSSIRISSRRLEIKPTGFTGDGLVPDGG